jgi:triacylglycerol lipase
VPPLPIDEVGNRRGYIMKKSSSIAAAGSMLLIALAVAALASCGPKQAAENAMLPVVFVPGIWDTGGTFDRLAEALGKAGRKTYEVTLAPDDGSVSLPVLAKELRTFLNDRLGRWSRFDLVAFSMGGLVARSYVQRLGGLARVDHFVTISTPHHGTTTADLGNQPGFLDMQPDSKFLLGLDRDAARLSRIMFTSIWTPLDLMIVPADSSRMPVGDEVKLTVLTHQWMMTDSRVIDAVLAALAVKR